jgi:hypothetical protein
MAKSQEPLNVGRIITSWLFVELDTLFTCAFSDTYHAFTQPV